MNVVSTKEESYIIKVFDGNTWIGYFHKNGSGWMVSSIGDASYGLASDPRIVRMQSKVTEDQLKKASSAFEKLKAKNPTYSIQATKIVETMDEQVVWIK